jgi:3-dehydroquinate dehydratase/shikimate dehydrogenase
VLGAGGAARAIVAALAHYGADVTIYNRTPARAEALAEEFTGTGAGGTVRAAGLSALQTLDAEIVINCTPIGMYPHVEACPLPDDDRLAEGMVVFDTIYNPMETQLLRRARRRDCQIVTGVDMFVNQAAAQYEFWTGRTAPRDVMRKVVLAKLSGA